MFLNLICLKGRVDVVVNISKKREKLIAAVETLRDKIVARKMGAQDLFAVETLLKEHGHSPNSVAHQQLMAVARYAVAHEYGASEFHARQLKSIVELQHKRLRRISLTVLGIDNTNCVVEFALSSPPRRLNC